MRTMRPTHNETTNAGPILDGSTKLRIGGLSAEEKERLKNWDWFIERIGPRGLE